MKNSKAPEKTNNSGNAEVRPNGAGNAGNAGNPGSTGNIGLAQSASELPLSVLVDHFEGKMLKPNEAMIRCPMEGHEDRNPSCHVTTGPDGKQQFWCFTCEVGQAEIAEAIEKALGMNPRKFSKSGKHKKPLSAWIYEDNSSRRDDVIKAYLKHRGITEDMGDITEILNLCRCHKHKGERFIVLPIKESPDGKINNLLKIPVDKGGEGKWVKVGRTRFNEGKAFGSAAWLGTPKKELALAEGAETAFSFHVVTGIPVAITGSAGNLDRLEIPESVETLYILVDRDPSLTGQKAAVKAAQLYETHKIDVYLVLPTADTLSKTPADYKDFNDLNAKQIQVRFKAKLKFSDIPEKTISDLLYMRSGKGKGSRHKMQYKINESDPPKLSMEKMKLRSLTLEIPDNVYDPGGLFSVGIEGLYREGLSPIRPFNFATISLFIANAISGKLIFNNIWPNLYHVKVGGPSSGKTRSTQAVLLAMKRQGVYFPMTSTPASGPAIVRRMEQDNILLMLPDECDTIFRRNSLSDTHGSDIKEVLLTIYTQPGISYEKAYANAKDNILIETPCLNFMTNATPLIFDNFDMKDMRSGLMQRLGFFVHQGARPPKCPYEERTGENLDAFVGGLREIQEAVSPAQKNMPQGETAPPHNCAKGIDKACANYIEELEKYWDAKTDEMEESDQDEAFVGITGRMYELSMKYAMVHIAGTRFGDDIFAPITVEDVEWGIQVAEMLYDWKMNQLQSLITTGDFHKDCEVFKAGILAALKKKKKPTIKIIADRRPRVRNWTERHTEDVIKALMHMEEIEVRGGDGENLVTAAFYLREDKSEKEQDGEKSNSKENDK